MSSFFCDICGAPCLDSERGYVSGCKHYPPDVAPAATVTRQEAAALAERYVPGIWGSLRTAWVNGFIGYPERGVAKYPRTSAAAAMRRRGVEDRRNYDRQETADGPNPDSEAG